MDYRQQMFPQQYGNFPPSMQGGQMPSTTPTPSFMGTGQMPSTTPSPSFIGTGQTQMLRRLERVERQMDRMNRRITQIERQMQFWGQPGHR